MYRKTAIHGLALASILIAGCARFRDDDPTSYTTVVTDTNHDVEKARADCRRATEFFEKGKLAKAESALQEALIADVTYAPAHNNLGHIYLQQGKLYLAAWEFEYARRLLPESADVVNNLGLVFQAAGREQEAIDSFTTALSLDEGNPQYAANLARALVRADKDPGQAAALLQDVVLTDSRPEWVAWAKEQLALREPIRTAAHHRTVVKPSETIETLPSTNQITPSEPRLPRELPTP